MVVPPFQILSFDLDYDEVPSVNLANRLYFFQTG